MKVSVTLYSQSCTRGTGDFCVRTSFRVDQPRRILEKRNVDTRVTFNERHAGAPNHTTVVRAMRVLTSFSLLGGTIRAHNTRELYATVKPGRISRRRRNLNSWKREEDEETGRTRDGEERNNREGERIGIREEKETTRTAASSDGYTRIMQINRNPHTTKRVPINSEMSPVKIQARREARCSPARTRANLD